MHLKIKVDFNEMQAFSQTLKYIFPFSETHTKRTLVVYESALQDE